MLTIDYRAIGQNQVRLEMREDACVAMVMFTVQREPILQCEFVITAPDLAPLKKTLPAREMGLYKERDVQSRQQAVMNAITETCGSEDTTVLTPEQFFHKVIGWYRYK